MRGVSDRVQHVVITGAAGFVGSATVHAALRAGLTVTAVVRPGSDRSALPTGERLCVVECDLSDSLADPSGLVRDADAVLHLAARMHGDDAQHGRDTVGPTARLLEVVADCCTTRFVLVSSLSVYGYRALHDGEVVSEATPLEARPGRRDAYCRAKLAQERLIQEADASLRARCAVLRPGAIVGPGRWWTARLGRQVGGGWLRIGNAAQLPLIHVEQVAAALVQAVTGNAVLGQTANLIANDPPTQRAYADALRPSLRPKWVATVPWPVARLAAGVCGAVLGGRGPGMLVPDRLHALVKPLRYDNTAMRQTLGDPGPIDLAAVGAGEPTADNRGAPAAADSTPNPSTGTAA